MRSQRRRFGPRVVLVGLAAGALLHGLFNLAAFTTPIYAIGLVIIGAVWTMSRFTWAQRVSPFRYRRNYPKVQCIRCQGYIRINSSFCRFCGAPIPARYGTLFCGYCDSPNRSDASYCTRCGDRLIS